MDLCAIRVAFRNACTECDKPLVYVSTLMFWLSSNQDHNLTDIYYRRPLCWRWTSAFTGNAIKCCMFLSSFVLIWLCCQFLTNCIEPLTHILEGCFTFMVAIWHLSKCLKSNLVILRDMGENDRGTQTQVRNVCTFLKCTVLCWEW